MIAFRDLAQMRATLIALSSQEEGYGGESVSHARHILLEPMKHMREETADLPLSSVVRGMMERAFSDIENEDGITIDVAASQIQMITNAILEDLLDAWFLMIPSNRREFYLQTRPPFGQAVEQAFPDAIEDIAAASRCLAYDEWTAAVFHMMRATEVALRQLARRLRIRGVVVKEWSRLLQDIEKAVAAKRQQRRTAKRDRAVQYYSEAQASIGGFKDAWRNHVMHRRDAKYDERDAMRIWEHVKALMEQLAEKPS